MLVELGTFENFWLRTTSGEAMMAAYAGLFTAVPNPIPAPGSSRDHAGWSAMAQVGHVCRLQGQAGRAVRHAEASQLLDDVKEWERAANEVGRRRAWEKTCRPIPTKCSPSAA